MLELMDGFKRPIAARHMEVSVDDGAVTPAGWESLHNQVQNISLFGHNSCEVRSCVIRIGLGDFKRPVPAGEFANVAALHWH